MKNDVLLSDNSLVEALGRRKASWSFQSLDGLKAVIREIPLFKQNVQTVHFEFVIHTIATAIELLSECPHITTFTTVLASSLNLTDIASSWPLLKELSCSETGHFSGSLENLAHLKVLCIKMWSNTSASNLRTSRPWLPLASAETLTELTLYPDRQVDPSFFDVPSLSTFHNLVSLTIGPLSPELCTYLVTSQCRLEIFGTQLLRYHTPIDMVRSMVQAPCLQTVKRFCLSDLDDERIPASSPGEHSSNEHSGLSFSTHSVRRYLPLKSYVFLFHCTNVVHSLPG